MTSADLNDLVPAQQEKLEGITPKISLMDAGDTEGKFIVDSPEPSAKAAGPS